MVVIDDVDEYIDVVDGGAVVNDDDTIRLIVRRTGEPCQSRQNPDAGKRRACAYC
jgi:hypothetical protein